MNAIASRASFRVGLGNQLRVIGALLRREFSGRYGRENIGYLWMIGEPTMLASIITLVHVAQPTHFASDIGPAPFAIIGYCTFIIFRGVFNRAEGAIEANQSLLYHQRISVFDILVARSLVDVVGCFLTMMTLLTLAVATGYASLPVRPIHLLAAVGFMTWWSFGLAMIAASVSYRSETIGRQLHVISYLSIPISGAFFAMDWAPPAFRSALAWFPMPLIFEQARYGQFRTASSQYVSPGYVAMWCAVLSYFGLVMIRRLRRRIHG